MSLDRLKIHALKHGERELVAGVDDAELGEFLGVVALQGAQVGEDEEESREQRRVGAVVARQQQLQRLHEARLTPLTDGGARLRLRAI